jgi:predicted nucleotidyltransferase component of viral defense system
VGGGAVSISKEALVLEAGNTGFRPEILEKVYLLLRLLEGFQVHPFLKGRLALKGGTALNLFEFNIPRLSVDVDLNYVGAIELERTQAERPKIEQAITAVCEREGLSVRRVPGDHAGGKWRLTYRSAVGETGTLALDINFMFRIPLWQPVIRDSHPVGSLRVSRIRVLDVHELAASKLVALLARHSTRDLFDAHQLLREGRLDAELLRVGFVAYGGMNRRDWRKVSVDDVVFDTAEIRNRLVPLLRSNQLSEVEDLGTWGERLVGETRQALSAVLPLSLPEMEFLDRLNGTGEIAPSLLTSDQELAERIADHPLIKWKAQNVRDYKRGV